MGKAETKTSSLGMYVQDKTSIYEELKAQLKKMKKKKLQFTNNTSKMETYYS